MRFTPKLPGANEVFRSDGPRSIYANILEELERTGPVRWNEKLRDAHELLLQEQYSFGIKEGDKTHPTDWLPRIIPAGDWDRLERGLLQRYRAINEFLRRLEAGNEEVVPAEIVESSILYESAWNNRFGPVPVRQISFDVVAIENNGGWDYRVIEENAKMPVGLAAMTRRRRMSREVFFPESHNELAVHSLDGWLERLGSALRAATPPGDDATLAVVSGGPDDQFYLDHHIYAEEMGAVLAETGELEIDRNGYLVHHPSGRRIDVIYERVDEDQLYAEVPGLLESHAEAKVHVLFAPNSEIVDDKGVGAFVPEMVRTYLGEEPLMENARTWSLAVDEDYRYVMDHFEELVVKSRGGYGGKEVMIGPESSAEAIQDFRNMVKANPVEYIAQETIDFSTHVLCETDAEGFLLRDSYADYRMLALAPDPQDPDAVEMIPGCLSRVAAPGKHVVNISSGGKMKDTWVQKEQI
ncbi:circularly permuted type 2 ATP-grasp protein [soil metagenome]